MENPFQQNMNGWGFKDYREWLLVLRQNTDDSSHLLKLDEQAEEFWKSEHENKRRLQGESFTLALISLSLPPPNFEAQNDKGKTVNVSQVLNRCSAALPIIQQAQKTAAERNYKLLRQILKIPTIEYRKRILDYIKSDKVITYQLVPSSPDPNSSFKDFEKYPDSYTLQTTELNKQSRQRTGEIMRLQEFNIERFTLNRWAVKLEFNGKKFLFSLAFALGLNDGLTDRLLQNEGLSYLDSVHPLEQFMARAFKSGFSYEMTRKIIALKGLSF